jgi:hypothetical protein
LIHPLFRCTNSSIFRSDKKDGTSICTEQSGCTEMDAVFLRGLRMTW